MIDPVLRSKAVPTHRMRVIAIDPGHGGSDRGAKGRLYEEKALVLGIAYKLRNVLRKKGYQVVMTRDRDVFPSLKQRPEYANKRHADIFISLHANSAGKKSYINGIETFSATPAGAASTHDSKPKYKRENGNSYDKNNSRLAYEIHKSLIKKTKAEDRGLKKARFLVIREAKCPAVLLELGFLTNPREERALGRSAYQQALADAIAEGIMNYHKVLNRK
jgi:N-acetylmuramoyl-L-alanine amidase